MPLEAAIGLVLLTAGLSWVVSLYPAFSRHRSLAHEISLVREAESEGVDPGAAAVSTGSE